MDFCVAWLFYSFALKNGIRFTCTGEYDLDHIFASLGSRGLVLRRVQILNLEAAYRLRDVFFI